MDLPDELRLPLDRGAPYWYWLGGRPALDLVNTLRERWWRRVETLVTPEDLADWLVAAGVLEVAPDVGADDLRRATALREAIDAAVVAATEHAGVPAATADAIDAVLAAAPERATVRREPHGALTLGVASLATPVSAALATVARDAAEMLGPEQIGRVRICASDTCSARFFDRSPGGRRRWCSMAGCGNVAKARRHRERRRSAPGGALPQITERQDGT